MTIAQQILAYKEPDFASYLREGNSLDDVDEYGFTPLIESIITNQPALAEQIILLGANVHTTDVTGQTPLHWAVEKNIDLVKLLLAHGANANAYTNAGLSVLVYPILRNQEAIKQLLYQHGANIDFALDFIYAKLMGHRYELVGRVDIVNAKNEFIEVEYEGFILEFTLSILKDSLIKFIRNYTSRHLKKHFDFLYTIIKSFETASTLLKLQHYSSLTKEQENYFSTVAQKKFFILPVASRGHALSFVRLNHLWAKIDRGENSLKEGSVNIYHITKEERIDGNFLKKCVYSKQPRKFFHQAINEYLGLKPIESLYLSPQISGNCSWSNIQGIIPVAYLLLMHQSTNQFDKETVLNLYYRWIEWDKDRALDECIQRFNLANSTRKASMAAILGGILFQTCKYKNLSHVHRAEKILAILNRPDYYYILNSYLEIYCVKSFTKRGNNLLKVLEECGINPNINVTPIATDLD